MCQTVWISNCWNGDLDLIKVCLVSTLTIVKRRKLPVINSQPNHACCDTNIFEMFELNKDNIVMIFFASN